MAGGHMVRRFVMRISRTPGRQDRVRDLQRSRSANGPVDMLREAIDCEPDPAEAQEGLAPHHPADKHARRTPRRMSIESRVALVVSALILAAVGGLTGYLGYRTYETHLASHQRELFVQTGRQAAINLTTVSYT